MQPALAACAACATMTAVNPSMLSHAARRQNRYRKAVLREAGVDELRHEVSLLKSRLERMEHLLLLIDMEHFRKLDEVINTVKNDIYVQQQREQPDQEPSPSKSASDCIYSKDTLLKSRLE